MAARLCVLVWSTMRRSLARVTSVSAESSFSKREWARWAFGAHRQIERERVAAVGQHGSSQVDFDHH